MGSNFLNQPADQQVCNEHAKSEEGHAQEQVRRERREGRVQQIDEYRGGR